MNETPAPALLSDERLAEIREDSDVSLYWVGGQRYPTDDMSARALNAVPDLLAHLAAREHQYTETLKSLHEAANRPDARRIERAATSLGIDLTT